MCFAFADVARGLRLSIALQRARLVADMPDVVSARLTVAETVSGAILRHTISRNARYKTADALLALAATAPDADVSARAAGTAHLLGDNFTSAVDAWTSIPEAHRTAADWSDLAAAHAAAASGPGAHEQWLLAFDATTHALRLQPSKAEALFNRAVAANALGIRPIAKTNWERYLAADSASRWAVIARQRFAQAASNERASWTLATASLENLSPADLATLTRTYPEHARRYAEGIFLANWAEHVGDDARAASRHLGNARVIGETLRDHNGESLLADAVGAIDEPHAAGCVRTLADGHLAYRKGRIAYDAGQLASAEHDLITAAALLRTCHSPMAAMAELYVSSALIDRTRLDDARRLLDRLLSAQRPTPGYKAVTANILWNIALCDAIGGRWSESLAAAREATMTYGALGEHANAAGTEAILAEDYDLLGQRALAWQHGISALRNASASGDSARARVILAVLCRTELRAKRWRSAGTLVDLERELAAEPNPKLDADMFLRAATVAHHLGRRQRADKAIASARAAVRTMPDPSSRLKLFADVDAVAGAISRHDDPTRAASLLTSAIAFQTRSARPIVLPQLYLERAHVHLQLRMRDAAEADLRAGIGELERERTHVADAEMRPGIFDDAGDLFDELIALQVDRHDAPADILDTVERGRARAVLEEMTLVRVPEMAPETIIPEVQRRLPHDATLVEYVSLPDRLLIFTIGRNTVAVHEIGVSRSVLAGMADDLARALAAETPEPDVRRLSAALYDLVIAPLGDRVRSATAVAFVPDTTLQRVPFAALFDRASGTYLIEGVAPTTHPSARVFIATHDRSLRWRNARLAQVTVFADPAVPPGYPNLQSLPGARRDARVIAKQHVRRTVLVGDDATAERFLDLAPRSEIVQFSGHAVFNTFEPGQSALLLASTHDRSGVLTQRTIAEMRLPRTRLVILAACSTMSGRNAMIEGVPSVARAFLVAGAPAVIGTLWDIEDGNVTRLMRVLHNGVAEGASPADALRAAQLDALRSVDPVRRHPRQWSAFSAMGH